MDIASDKPLAWLADSLDVVRSFPPAAQRVAGFELRNVQQGKQPSDSKPMPSIGVGVEEIRLWVESGTYRLNYLARLPEAVYVLHAFKKTTQKTSLRDLRLAKARLEHLLRLRKSGALKTNLQ